jgi:nucleolar protein 58
MARVLAAKAALGIRVDALQDWGDDEANIPEDEKAALGLESRFNLERKLAGMEGKPLKPRGVAVNPNGIAIPQPKKWEIKEARKYNPDADGLAGDEAPAAEESVDPSKKDKKKEKKDKKAKKLIEEIPEPNVQPVVDEDSEVDESSDFEIEDEVESQPDEPITKEEADVIRPSSAKMNGLTNGHKDGEDSDTIPTVSDDSADSADSPTPQERNWQSSILGNTKEAKKKRKIERHERKLLMSEQKAQEKKARNEKLARRLDRKERRERKAQQVDRRAAREEEQYLEPAAKCGLSITRYKRKLERGEIKFEADGTPVAISKKEIKKAKKAAEKVAETNGTVEKKRKRDDGEETPKDKKKKKSKA